MRILALINHGLLLLLGVATGGIKVAGPFTDKFNFEFALFAKIGFPFALVVVFGVIQVVGALMLLHPKTVKPGAMVLLVTFVIATAPLFVVGNYAFAVFSLVFWAMAMGCYAQNKFSEEG